MWCGVMMMMVMMMISYFCRTRNMRNRNVGFSFYLLFAGKHPVTLIFMYGAHLTEKWKLGMDSVNQHV